MTNTAKRPDDRGSARDERSASDPAPDRPWAALALLALPCLVVSMDNNVLGLAVPAVSADLHPSAVQLLWIGDAYTFVGAATLLVAGSLGDRLGHRRLLLWGAVAFGACSVLAGAGFEAGSLHLTLPVVGQSLSRATSQRADRSNH